MKLPQKIASYALIGLGSIGLLACECKNPKCQIHNPKYSYLTGIVINEQFQNNLIIDQYTFSLNTKYGLKICKTSYSSDAGILDVLINQGDKVKMRLNFFENVGDKNFITAVDHIIEINDQKINR